LSNLELISINYSITLKYFKAIKFSRTASRADVIQEFRDPALAGAKTSVRLTRQRTITCIFGGPNIILVYQ